MGQTEKGEDMDAHLRSQMTFVFFCCSSFVMLVLYIALDDSFGHETILTVARHPSDENMYVFEETTNKKNKECLPVQHLAFLPMKQTKSFLLQAMFIHYGLKNHLSFAISNSANGGFRNGLGHPFSPSASQQSEIIGYIQHGIQYDIICHEMVLDAAKIYDIVPQDTKFIGILRNPVTHFKDMWDSNGHKWSLTKEIERDMVNETSHIADMKIFLNDPWKYLGEPMKVYKAAELLKGREFDKRRARIKMAPYISSLLYTRNPQLATYGFEVFQHSLADSLTQSMISSVEAQFHLILIDEYIDISLAILKHKLCWSYKEVVTVASALKRPAKAVDYDTIGFDADLIIKLKELNKADFDFYEQMNKTFWETVYKIGEHKIRTIASTIVDTATRLQERCVEKWEKYQEDYVPIIKEESRSKVECQRIELIRTTSVIKTLQNRQHKLALEHYNSLLKNKNGTSGKAG